MGHSWMLYSNCWPDFFLVWKDNKPKPTKAAGIGALISVGCSILYWVLVSCVGIGVGFLGA